MVKITRLVVCGPPGVGKTSLIEQCIYGNHTEKSPEKMIPTVEDTYNALVETDRGTKERTRIYDIGGSTKVGRHYVSCADAFILVYDVNSPDTLSAVQALKREIDEYRAKREVFFVLCGNKTDQRKKRIIDQNELARWAQLEKTHMRETSIFDRQSLCNLFSWVVSRVTQSQSKSGFSFGKKDTRAFLSVTGPSKSEQLD
ncbi:unnamed protein product [Calicophoron daubneyi]|uniref:NF-kappa-B inhibitor-interacting Ras-like protein 2 n=1 Tax=Calicophoron daubneyi TaxID=300641 RepID=A0AAV2TX68_CALDB